MEACITHYFRRGSLPFQSLSALTDSEALSIMERLSDDSPVFSRFKEPHRYLRERKVAETWLRAQFMAKGGQPQAGYPHYAVLGTSEWMEQRAAAFGIDMIRIPLSQFTENDVSFTYPDSMVTYWVGRDQPAEYYQPDYHGQVFTLTEAKAKLLHQSTELLGKRWRMPEGTIPYIEAQLWNHELLLNFS